MNPRAALDRGVSTGLRLGRGTADRAVRVVGPALARVVDTVASRVRRAPAPTPTTATFVPSRREPPAPGLSESVVEAPASPAGPTPASVAQNIAPKRPSVKAPRKPAAKRSAPGAKLPPPRPSAT